MLRRTLSFLMALLLTAQLLPAAAFAQETDTSPDTTMPTQTAPAETEATLPALTEPDTTEPQVTEPEESLPVETEPQETLPVETEPQETLPEETLSQEIPETQPEEEEPEEEVPELLLPEDTELPYDSQELLDGYVSSLFFGEMATWGVLARDRLTPSLQFLYDSLKLTIQEIAAGNRASTVITVLYSGSGYSVSSLDSTSISTVFNALYHDCPYDLYWYGGWSAQRYSSSNKVVFYLIPYPSYRPSNYNEGSPTIDTSDALRAAAAARNAAAVVSRNAALGDYDKIAAYADTICSLVEYDHTAADNNTYNTDINPWTLVNVFDNDPTTNVVCEGYAESFQYLCDLSTFRQDIQCYSVTGANHKWNIVRINGSSYLMDLTGCDGGSSASRYGYFLAGGQGSITQGYQIAYFHYWYYDETIALWGGGNDSILMLSPTNYNPYAEPLYSGTCGENLTWSLSRYGALEISGTGDMTDYSATAKAPWSDYLEDISYVDIRDGVTGIGSCAFADLSVGSIHLPDSVNRIGMEAFRNASMQSIRMSSGLTSIGADAFLGSDLPEVIIPDVPGWCAISFGNIHANPMYAAGTFRLESSDTCTTEVTLPAVVSAYAFAGCEDLEIIRLPAQVQIGFRAFTGCDNAEIRFAGTMAQWEAVDYSGAIPAVCTDGTILGRGITDPGTGTADDPIHDNIRWCIRADGQLSLTGSGELVLDHTEFTQAPPWHSLKNRITSVVIGSGITSLCAYTLKELPNCTSVIIGADVKTIADNAVNLGSGYRTIVFRGCPTAIGSENFSGMDIWAYYCPADGWTDDQRKSYQASSILWLPYDQESEISFSGPVAILHDTDSLTSGESMLLKAELFGRTGLHPKWLVSDPGLATVSSSGKLTAKQVSAATTVRVSLVAYPETVNPALIPAFTDKLSDLPAGCSLSTEVFTIVPLSTGVQIRTAGGTALGDGETVLLDMAAGESLTLYAGLLPEDAAQSVVWTSGDKSGKFAEYDTESQKNAVTIHPTATGTVTLTATAGDGSGKSAKVKVQIYYADMAKKLTASVNVPKIGLQEGQSTIFKVFGTDKDQTIASHLLNYVSSDTGIAAVDQYGVITAGGKPGTATLTASLAGDPLKRSVSVKVKVIPSLTAAVTLTAQAEDPFHSEDTPGVAGVYLDLEDLTGKMSFILVPSAVNGLGHSMKVDKSSFKWASSDKGIASVKVNADGTATVTINPKADGSCLITATSKDLAKITGSFRVTVRNYQPELESTTLTLNSYFSEGVSLGLTERYGNRIKVSDGELEIALYEYNSKTRTYASTPSARLHPRFESGRLTITSSETLTGTIKLRMVVGTDMDTYTYDLTVRVKNSLPAVTIKQTEKFNAFLTTGSAPLAITAKNAQIQTVEAESQHFRLVSDTAGIWRIVFSDAYLSNPDVKLNTAMTLTIRMQGYEIPVVKTIKVSAKAVKPSLKFSASSSIVNPDLGQSLTANLTMMEKDGTLVPLGSGDYTVTVASGDVSAKIRTDHRLELTLLKGKSASAVLEVRHKDWVEPITLKHKISTSTKLPTAKPGESKLTLVRSNPTTAATEIVLNQSNAVIGSVSFRSAAKEGSTAWEQAQHIKITWLDGKIQACFDDGLPNKGTYTFKFAVTLTGGQVLSEGTIKVVVKN